MPLSDPEGHDLPIPPPVVQFTHIVLRTHCAPCQDMPSFQLSVNELVGANVPFYACQTVLSLAFLKIYLTKEMGRNCAVLTGCHNKMPKAKTLNCFFAPL